MENRSVDKKWLQGIAFAAGFLCLSLLNVQAMGRGLSFGIRYEAEKSWLKNSTDKDAGAQLTAQPTKSYLNGGIAIGYDINHLLGLEINVLRSRQGQSYTGINPMGTSASYTREVVLQSILNNELIIGSYQAKAELNCIKIPLLLKITSPKMVGMSLHGEVGPQLNMISSVVYELNYKDVELPGTNMTPDDAYKKTTLEGVVSAGVGYELTRHLNVSADIRYDHGFKDVENKGAMFSVGNGPSQSYYSPDRSATFNSTLGLMIGVNFKL